MDKPEIQSITREEFAKLQLGAKIFVQDKFDSQPAPWLEAEVTRGTLPRSVIPAIHFRVTDARASELTRKEEMIYFDTDASFVAYRH